MVSLEWANSLVGRDWEIYWNDQEENDGKDNSSSSIITTNEKTATKDGDEQVVVAVVVESTESKNTDSKILDDSSNSNDLGPLPMDIDSNLEKGVGDSSSLENSGGAKVLVEKEENQQKQDKEIEDEDEDDDDESVGSIIDDWYAGRVLSVSQSNSKDGCPTFTFQVTFIGDEETYEMILDPSKVRPSAWGWVKHTKALLYSSQKIMPSTTVDDDDDQIPPDTSMDEDRDHLQRIQEEINSKQYGKFTTPDQSNDDNNNNGMGTIIRPVMEELKNILHFRYLLKSQIYLRSRLAKIERIHGSAKFNDDGERNPTEPYVNHLVQCLKDLDYACDWFCRCWNLFVKLFGDSSSSSSTNNNNNMECQEEEEEEEEEAITIDQILLEYLDIGKSSIENCLSIDFENSNSSKRRQPATLNPLSRTTSTTTPRRAKKRRKKNGTSSSHHSSSSVIGFTMEEIYSTPSEFLENFSFTTTTNKNDSSRGPNHHHHHHPILKLFEKMMQSLVYFIAEPALNWKHQARQLLGDEEDGGDNVEGSTTNNKNSNASQENNDDDDDDELANLEEGSSSDESSDEKERNFYTYEEIESCLAVLETSSVLKALHWGTDREKLESKISTILEIEKTARELLFHVADGDGNPPEGDEILKSLKTIVEDIASPIHPLYNVEPIGREYSPITRGVLLGGIELRTWLLDVRHTEHVRERAAFIQDLVSRMADLPDLEEVLEYKDNAFIVSRATESSHKVKAMGEGAVTHAALNSFELWPPTNIPALVSLQGVDEALATLRECPIILPVEEQLAIRRDIILWGEKARALQSGNGIRIDFLQLDNINKDLQSITKGQSSTRIQLVKDLYPNEKIDSEMAKFGLTDVVLVCGQIVETLSVLHNKASKWKNRSESIISSLCMHGNASAGDTIAAQKLPPMVDIKRINDLISEYSTLQVEVPGYIDTLKKVQENCNQWVKGVYEKILEQQISIEESLSFLQNQRVLRPRGMIMDPTRQVYDSLVDLLVWHQHVKDSMKNATEEISVAEFSSAAVEEKPESSINKAYSRLMLDSFYPLLLEGIEAIESYAKSVESSLELQNNFDACIRILDDLGYRKTTRAVSLEKLQPHPLGSPILSRMIGLEPDMSQGYPLFMMMWVKWHLLVSQLVSRCEKVSETGNTSRGNSDVMIPPSLVEAKTLMAQEPTLKNISETGLSIAALLLKAKTVESDKLGSMILAADSAEEKMRLLLSKSKDLLKGGIQKAELVQQHLGQLKELQMTFKTHARSRDYLSLDPSIEPKLDRHIKAFSWFVRTFSYSFLHLDEASYSAPVDEGSIERVPWDVLVSLHDRIPLDEYEPVGAFALVILRVRELYEAGKKWQDEITRTTMITKRGGKRRIPGGSPKKEEDPEATSKLQMETMKKLAKHPILSKVAMPREKAVKRSLESSKEFEIKLLEFLGQDYEGSSLDRAMYPKSDSLVAKEGEFILYRLTGNPLFEEVQSRVNVLSQIGENVLAETPGKATFEWIMSAVTWIESLADAVTTKSPFKETEGTLLVIPASEAKKLVTKGEEIFLNVPDDLKRTLSKHGIFVTTNQQEKTIKVTVKKDGAHHSCGGTVIRWCPILFDSLKNDLAKEEKWQNSLTETLNQFQVFFKANVNVIAEEVLYQWFCFGEKIGGMLDIGQESLVVTPAKNYTESMQNLLLAIQGQLEKNSNPQWNQTFARKWLAESTSLMEDRSLLLESLLYRKTMAKGQNDASIKDELGFDDSNKTFRDTCRSYLEKALGKSLKVCGITMLPELMDLEPYCSIKAWEIETIMFERFQGDFGISRISDDYRDKARNLRTSLEHKDNLSLCLRILLGEIDSTTLVSMSSEELASQKSKMDREKAKQAAKSSTLLTPRVEPTTLSTLIGGEMEKDKGDVKNPPNLSIVTPEEDGNKNAQIVTSHPGVANGMTNSSDTQKDIEPLPISKKIELGETSEKFQVSSASMKTLTKASSNTKPPPPPPSLVQSFQQSAEESIPLSLNAATRDRGKRFMSSTGGDRFRIIITNPRLTFSVAFYQEDDSHAGVDVPETLAEKGRLKIEEFSRFLSEKLSTGRWVAIPLRLTTLSEQDMRLYKKFYKEYEVKQRIAMFSVSQNTKVFLVTPKFHGAAKSTGYISLPNKTSSYAIVLTKETFFVD